MCSGCCALSWIRQSLQAAPFADPLYSRVFAQCLLTVNILGLGVRLGELKKREKQAIRQKKNSNSDSREFFALGYPRNVTSVRIRYNFRQEISAHLLSFQCPSNSHLVTRAD